MPTVGETSSHRIELVAALGLTCLYLAVMSGHFLSIDGLVMWRQALSLVYHHSLAFVPPIWWGSDITTGSRGLGASLQYFAGLLAFPWLAQYVPVQQTRAYDFRLLYGDPLYTTAGAPIWVIVTVATAYLVALTTRALGATRRAPLWAMAFYGLGSPALAASRGDWPQPLVAICWVAGVYAALRFKDGAERHWLFVCAASIFYGVLTRPLEGSLLTPAIVILLWRGWRERLPVIIQVTAWVGAVVVTMLFNWARYGSVLNFGYAESQLAWTTSIWVGLPGAIVSPGRGVLWEFPALALAVLGTAFLWKRGKRLEAFVLAGLPTVLLLEACQYNDWVGGWDWGFRFFQPALPLAAVVAGIGAVWLPRAVQRWLPAVLLLGGLVWNIPVVATDILGGYGATYADTWSNFRLEAYPPIGAWRFLHHVRPLASTDSATVDIVWFRATQAAGWTALIPFLVLVAASAALWISALKAELSRPASLRSL